MSYVVGAEIQHVERDTVITKQEAKINEDGTYQFAYETNNGVFRSENKDKNGKIVVKYGINNGEGERRVEFSQSMPEQSSNKQLELDSVEIKKDINEGNIQVMWKKVLIYLHILPKLITFSTGSYFQTRNTQLHPKRRGRFIRKC